MARADLQHKTPVGVSYVPIVVAAQTFFRSEKSFLSV